VRIHSPNAQKHFLDYSHARVFTEASNKEFAQIEFHDRSLALPYFAIGTDQWPQILLVTPSHYGENSREAKPCSDYPTNVEVTR